MTPEIDVLRAPLERGALLVALPTLVDPNFQRTLVLLVEASEDGAMGLVINRPTALQLADALPEQELLRGTDVPVFEGGPMKEDRILILRNGGEELDDFIPVFGDVSLGGTVDALKEAATTHGITGAFRPFRGFAGWDPGQLEEEIEEQAWGLLPGDTDVVFSDHPGGVWAAAMGMLGGPFAFYASMPADLSRN